MRFYDRLCYAPKRRKLTFDRLLWRGAALDEVLFIRQRMHRKQRRRITPSAHFGTRATAV